MADVNALLNRSRKAQVQAAQEAKAKQAEQNNQEEAIRVAAEAKVQAETEARSRFEKERVEQQAQAEEEARPKTLQEPRTPVVSEQGSEESVDYSDEIEYEMSPEEIKANRERLREQRLAAMANSTSLVSKSEPVSEKNENEIDDELYREMKGRRAKPHKFHKTEDESLYKPAALRPFPRPLIDMLTVSLGASNLSAPQVVAVAVALYLNLSDDEAQEIFSTAFADNKALSVFKAAKRDVSTQAGVESWASKIENKLDDLSFELDAVKIAAIHTVIDYAGGFDSPGAGSDISYENDVILRGYDKLDEDVRKIRQRKSVEKGRPKR